MALKKNALDPVEQEKECTHEMGFPYTGTIPNTGPRVCRLCGTDQADTVLVTCRLCGFEFYATRGTDAETSRRCPQHALA